MHPKTSLFILPVFLGLPTLGQVKTATIYTTAANTQLRLSQNGQLNFSPWPQPMETEPFVLVDPAATFQSYIGIGGALTDASAEPFAKLSTDKQQELLTAYYDPQKGIGFTLARTNIQSCDFSSDTYSYVADNDTELKTFDIAHDMKYRVPFIKQ